MEFLIRFRLRRQARGNLKGLRARVAPEFSTWPEMGGGGIVENPNPTFLRALKQYFLVTKRKNPFSLNETKTLSKKANASTYYTVHMYFQTFLVVAEFC